VIIAPWKKKLFFSKYLATNAYNPKRIAVSFLKPITHRKMRKYSTRPPMFLLSFLSSQLRKGKRPGVGGKREAGGGVLTPDAVCARLVQTTPAVKAGVAGGGAQARHSHSTGFESAFPHAPATRAFLLKTQEFRNILICKNNSFRRLQKKDRTQILYPDSKKMQKHKNISISKLKTVLIFINFNSINVKK
jgi:hypothetical protein